MFDHLAWSLETIKHCFSIMGQHPIVWDDDLLVLRAVWTEQFVSYLLVHRIYPTLSGNFRYYAGNRCSWADDWLELQYHTSPCLLLFAIVCSWLWLWICRISVFQCCVESPPRIILGLNCVFMSFKMLYILVIVSKADWSVSGSQYMFAVVYIVP